MIDTTLVPPKTVANAKGDGQALNVSSAANRVFLLTLDITNIIEQQALDVSIYASADGTIWSRVRVAAAVFGSNDPSDSMELSAVVPNGAGLIAVGDTPTFDARLRYDGGLVWMAKPAR